MEAAWKHIGCGEAIWGKCARLWTVGELAWWAPEDREWHCLRCGQAALCVLGACLAGSRAAAQQSLAEDKPAEEKHRRRCAAQHKAAGHSSSFINLLLGPVLFAPPS